MKKTAKKTILFINQREDIKEEATKILEEEGYATLFTADYDQAIEYITDKEKNVVMVILDINMLVDEGVDIYDRIKEINPNLPVVTTSTAGHYRPVLGAEEKTINFGPSSEREK